MNEIQLPLPKKDINYRMSTVEKKILNHTLNEKITDLFVVKNIIGNIVLR